jgi:serine protease Do
MPACETLKEDSLMARWSIAVVCLIVGGLAGSLLVDPILHGQSASVSAAPRELTSYRGIVKEVLPAVVSIQGKAKPRPKADNGGQRRFRSDNQIPEEFRRFFPDFEFEIPTPDEQPQVGFGSGFIVDPKGIILTNYHVVGGAEQVEITLNDGRIFVSKDIHGDKKTDLAIVRVDTKEPLPYLELGDSDAMEIGDRVLAVGAPFGLVGTVTAGIISAKDRTLKINLYEDFLQTDAAINPGNSGGPLINMDAKVIGIDSAIKSRTGAFQGIGLAIPSNMAKAIMKDLTTAGVVHRGYLGVQVGQLQPDVAARLGLHDHRGVAVGKVFEDSPAAKAGLEAGDIIISVNGKGIKDGRELQHAILGIPVGQIAKLSVFRDGKPIEVEVKIEEQPENYGLGQATSPPSTRPSKEGHSVDKYGLELEDLTPETAKKFGYKEQAKGALVTQVQPGSSAADQGLQPGMLITHVDKQPVESAESARGAMMKAPAKDGVLVQVQDSQGLTQYRILKPELAK